jgi:uncharacterized membrane protein (UPF0136 family)
MIPMFTIIAKIIDKSIVYIVIAIYTSLLFYCSPLDITQINLGDKSSSLLYESVSGNISGRSPLYSIFGWIITRIGHPDVMMLSIFLSIIPAVVSLWLVYLLVKQETGDKFYAITSMIIMMASGLYFLQAQKIEPYCLTSMLVVLALYLVVNKHFSLSAVIAGLSILAHPLAGLILIVFAVHYHEFRSKMWIAIGIPIISYLIMILFQGRIEGMSLIDSVTSFGNTFSFAFIKSGYEISSLLFIAAFGIIPFLWVVYKESTVYFTLGILTLSLPICNCLTNFPGVNLLSMLIPISAVIAGMGMKYIHWKKLFLVLNCSVLLLMPFIFNVRSIDNVNGFTTARNMINDIKTLQTGDYLYERKMYDGRIILDGYFIRDAVAYVNYTDRKNIKLIDSGVFEPIILLHSENLTSINYFSIVDVNNLACKLEQVGR